MTIFCFLPVADFIYSTSPYILDRPDIEQSIITYRAQIRALLCQDCPKKEFSYR